MAEKTYREIVSEMAMGDESSTDEVAARLHRIDELYARQEEGQEQSTVERVRQQARTELDQYQRNSKALNTWRLANPHLAGDEELYARMTEIDSQLYANPESDYSTLPFSRRLEIASEIAECELGDPSTRDNVDAIRTMAKSRAGRSSAFLDDAPDYSQDEESQRHHEAVQELIEQRKAQQQELAERALRFREQQPRPQRAVPWSRDNGGRG